MIQANLTDYLRRFTVRKLASIRVVSEILEHTNADALELVIVDGWQVVALKGKHKAGEKVVFFEVDSVLPLKPCFEFLRKSCYIKKDWLEQGEGLRLKTIKLRKELSQGLVMALEDLGIEDTNDLEADQDWTEALGVVKYDPPVSAQLAGQAKGNFPSFVPKTDQNRIQNVYKRIMNGIERGEIVDSWEVSLKLEGSSMTIYRNDDDTWGVCSRNIDLKLDQLGNSFVDTFHRLMEETNLSKMPNGTAIQGELIGTGIQGNIEKLSGIDFRPFSMYCIYAGEYYAPDFTKHSIDSLGLDYVPTLGNCSIGQMSLQQLLDMADGPSINAKLREGLVFKNKVDSSLSFKVISNKYLLKER